MEKIVLLSFVISYILAIRLVCFGALDLLVLFRNRGLNPLSVISGAHEKDAEVIGFKNKNRRRLQHLMGSACLTAVLVLARFVVN
jgi:hypothetical protein